MAKQDKRKRIELTHLHCNAEGVYHVSFYNPRRKRYASTWLGHIPEKLAEEKRAEIEAMMRTEAELFGDGSL